MTTAGAARSSPANSPIAVLSADYLTAPVNEIGKIHSVLTMVGGKVVFAAQPFEKPASGDGR